MHLDVVGAFDHVVVGQQVAVAARRSRPSRGRPGAAAAAARGRRRRSGTTDRRCAGCARRRLLAVMLTTAGDGPLGGVAVAVGACRGRSAPTFCTGAGSGTIGGAAAAAAAGSAPRRSHSGFSVATTNSTATATVTVCEKRSQALRIASAKWCGTIIGARAATTMAHGFHPAAAARADDGRRLRHRPGDRRPAVPLGRGGAARSSSATSP